MKKIMIVALLMLSSTVAFSAESEALKAILKAKTYAEASDLLKSSLSQLPSAEEKAKAYNKLLDLASDKFEKELLTVTSNQAAEKLKQGKVEPYDTLGYYDAAYNAVIAAVECDKYDLTPNEKGKIKPKFHAVNTTRIKRLRDQLLNAGNWAAEKGDNKGMLKYWGTYVATVDEPLVAESAVGEDQYLSQVSLLSSRVAYLEGQYELANKYVDVALRDKSLYDDALTVKMAISEKFLKTAEDTLNFVKNLEEMYENNSSNDKLFNSLYSYYYSLGLKEKAVALVDNKLAAEPGYELGWALKGLTQMNEGNLTDAIESLKKGDQKNVLVLSLLGQCLNTKAAEATSNADRIKLYTESLQYLEKARDLDPLNEQGQWGPYLRQCYYNLYGENDPRFKEVNSLLGGN